MSNAARKYVSYFVLSSLFSEFCFVVIMARPPKEQNLGDQVAVLIKLTFLVVAASLSTLLLIVQQIFQVL